MILQNKKGIGVEDTPFMILATVAVLMMVVWIGIEIMAGFVEGNEYQAAVEASTEIYKRAKLLSLTYDGSSESIRVSIPSGYSVSIGGDIVALQENSTLTEPLKIKGIQLTSDDSPLESGDHELSLIYSAQNHEIVISEV